MAIVFPFQLEKKLISITSDRDQISMSIPEVSSHDSCLNDCHSVNSEEQAKPVCCLELNAHKDGIKVHKDGIKVVDTSNDASTFSNSLLVPDNFGVVYPGIIYRSACPRASNFNFLESLHIRTIISLRQEEYSEEDLHYFTKHHINYYHIAMPGSKHRKNDCISSSSNPDISDVDDLVRKTLQLLLNKENWPVLLHCSRGKHRTGIVIGCLRALMNWPVGNRLQEYISFSHPKEREVDEEYIQNFSSDPSLKSSLNDLKRYISDSSSELADVVLSSESPTVQAATVNETCRSPGS